MVKKRPGFPLGLPIVAGGLLALGLVAGSQVRSWFSEEILAKNVLLSAIPFILVFVGILLMYITVIRGAASILHSRVSARMHRLLEILCMAGIVLGVIGMFQPWWFAAYRVGFLVLLGSTLAHILWSHVTPKEVRREEFRPGAVRDVGASTEDA